MAPRQRLNCWEYQGCERGPGGRRSARGEQCPASETEPLNGSNGGTHAGRACWVVTDTLCSGVASGPYERKIYECRKCSFYARVHVEQGLAAESPDELVGRLRCE